MKLNKLMPGRKLLIGFIPVVIWMAVIFIFSSQPANESYRQSEAVLEYVESAGGDLSMYEVRKLAHVGAYFVLGGLVYNFVRQFKQKQFSAFLLSFFIVAAYATSDELHQKFVSGRSGELRDIVIDSISAGLGIMAVLCAYKLHKRYRSKNPAPTKDTRPTILRWINKGTAACLAVSFVAAGFLVYSLQLLPTFTVLLLGVLAAIPVLTLCYMLLKNLSASLFKNAFMTIASLILTTIFTFTAVLAGNTSSFIASLRGIEYEDQTYNIVAIEGRGVELKRNNDAIGHIESDQNKNAVLKEVRQRTAASPKSYDNITTTTVALEDRAVNSVVIRETYLQLFSENYESFYEDLIILDTFNIRVQKQISSGEVDITKPFAVYISGIDTYGDVAKVSRSDVNIVAIVNPISQKILLVNTPRDFYVRLHNTTGHRDKLTHAGIYGIEMSKETLADLYEIDIHYYVRINFSSLLRVVDALDGITVDSDQAFETGKYQFKKGPNDLDGDAALAFSRTRKAFADGDRTRGKNQQRVIEAIVNKIVSPSIIVKYQNIIQALEGTVQTNADNDVITALIKQQMETIGQWEVKSISVTGSDSRGYTYSMGSIPLYVMEPDRDSVDEAIEEINEYLQMTAE